MATKGAYLNGKWYAEDSPATITTNGLMSYTDKANLDYVMATVGNIAEDLTVAFEDLSAIKVEAAEAAAAVVSASEAATAAQAQAIAAAETASQAAENLGDTVIELSNEIDSRSEWINWNDTALTIGRSTAVVTTTYQDSSVTISQDGIALATFADNLLRTPVIEVGSKLSIGKSTVGTFDWIYEDAGDLVFKHSGGA